MSMRNIIQTTFDEFGKSSFGAKKSGCWYRRSDETVVVLNLQKSNYGARYYVNVAIWLLAAGPADAPKPSHCHIQARLEGLIPAVLQERLKALLNLDNPLEDDVRRQGLLALLGEHLRPLVEPATTLEGLRSGEGQRLVKASLVDGDGQRLMAR